MSKVENWQLSDFYQSRREKIVNLLLSEIIFLKSHIKETNTQRQHSSMELALERLDYILELIRKNDKDLPEHEFNSIINLVYNILKEIVSELEKTLF